eukprot:3109986-Rhodomonas_salina.1
MGRQQHCELKCESTIFSVQFVPGTRFRVFDFAGGEYLGRSAASAPAGRSTRQFSTGHRKAGRQFSTGHRRANRGTKPTSVPDIA